jgi:uncharacterized protein (DUF1800 family)
MRSDGIPLAPNTNIEDARLRWLFRMLHSPRPLQERMTLFWHGFFATGYTKVESFLGADRCHAPDGELGIRRTRRIRQIEKLRANALGRFGDLM